jgi:hypothetical protein
MLIEKHPILLLEGLPAVMFPLPFDVPNHIWQLGLAYSKGAISILPGKGASVKSLVELKTGSAL